MDKHSCTLCGGRVGRPIKRSFDDGELEFCCHGCVEVYGILRAEGLPTSLDTLNAETVKRLSPRLPADARSFMPQRDCEEASEQGAAHILLDIGGMHCSTCSWLIERTLRNEPGVIDCQVNFAADRARVTYRPGPTNLSSVKERVKALGYTASFHERGVVSEQAHRESMALLFRLAVAAILGMTMMGIRVMVWQIDGNFNEISENNLAGTSILRYMSWFLSTPVQFYSGWPFLKGAYQSLRRGVANMDVLIALGSTAAYVYSAVSTVRGHGDIYFDTATMIVALTLVGKYIEASAKSQTASAVEDLLLLAPRKARLWADGEERLVSIEAVRPGDLVLIKPGEQIPADGQVVEGKSFVDESMFTGEPLPVSKVPGQDVSGGTINGEGRLVVRVGRVGEDSLLAQVISLVERAQLSRVPVQRLVDRVSGVFVPVVILFALTAGAAQYMGGHGPSHALMTAIAVVVIACPCALGLATPTALMVGVGRAAGDGVFFKSGEAIEAASRVDTVVFDKTGTLTRGEMVLSELVLDEEAGVNREGLLALVAGVEQGSEHPLGQCAARAARDAGVSLPPVEDFESLSGKGVAGSVSGLRVWVGTGRLMEEAGLAVGDGLLAAAGRLAAAGQTVVYAGWDGRARGVLAFADQVKHGARDAVATLRNNGYGVVLFTGDNRQTAAAIARECGIDEVQADMLPADKVERIAALQADGRRVAMVGDGINDAPALARADLGIALGTGTGAAIQAAGVTLLGGDVGGAIKALDLARRCYALIKMNLFWAFIYNLAGLTLAGFGLINPIWAAAAMGLSSVSVVLNSLRLRKERINRTWVHLPGPAEATTPAS